MASCLALANERSQMAQWKEGNKLDDDDEEEVAVEVAVSSGEASAAFSVESSFFV